MVEQCFIPCQPYSAVRVHVSFVRNLYKMHIKVPLFLWAVEVELPLQYRVSQLTQGLTGAAVAVSGGSRDQHLFAWCLELCLLGQTLSVNHFSPQFIFFLLWFFFSPVLTFLRASFICSHRAAGAVLLQSVTGRQWPLHQKVFHSILEVDFKSFFSLLQLSP